MALSSKHSNYYRAPERFCEAAAAKTELIHNGLLVRYYDCMHEKARFEYISSKVTYRDASVLDVGCNTGYFLFAGIDAGARQATGYEGSVQSYSILKGFCKEESRISVYNQYYEPKEKQQYDVIHLLNVLHHVGDDYLNEAASIPNAKKFIAEQLIAYSYKAKFLVLQIGFNWKGNVDCPLFARGHKKELIDFIVQTSEKDWVVENIGVAVSSAGIVVYEDLNEDNIKRDDSLGEFLNRPIFILKSKNLF